MFSLKIPLLLVHCEAFPQDCYTKLPCGFTSLYVCSEHSIHLQKIALLFDLKLTLVNNFQCKTNYKMLLLGKEYVLLFCFAYILSQLSLQSVYMLLTHPFSSP